MKGQQKNGLTCGNANGAEKDERRSVEGDEEERWEGLYFKSGGIRLETEKKRKREGDEDIGV